MWQQQQPSLEAQLCDLADQIAYNAHDIDDLRKALMALRDHDKGDKSRAVKAMRDISGVEAVPEVPPQFYAAIVAKCKELMA